MIDLKVIENELNELHAKLNQKRNELTKAKESNLKEQYGDDYGCKNCAYSCCIDVGDYHNSCVNGMCILCSGRCVNYIPENELSAYIRKHHYYDNHMVDTLDELFDVSDIMRKPELHQKALEILRVRDKKENK